MALRQTPAAPAAAATNTRQETAYISRIRVEPLERSAESPRKPEYNRAIPRRIYSSAL